MAKKGNSLNNGLYALAAARITLGLIMLWAFFDKLLGLGFATCRDAQTNIVTNMCEKAWINGGSPTTGFLKFAAKGPFESIFQSMVGNSAIDMLFMAGLLLIGASLILGIGMKIATVSGALLVLMMWAAVLPPENHPVLDDHIVYALLLMALLGTNSDQKWGLRSWWVKQPIVARFPVLE